MSATHDWRKTHKDKDGRASYRCARCKLRKVDVQPCPPAYFRTEQPRYYDDARRPSERMMKDCPPCRVEPGNR